MSVRAIALACAATLFASCAASKPRHVPTPLGPPGSLVAFEPVGAPAGAAAWKIRYVSTGLDGKRIPVTGVVIAPVGSAGERPVVSYAHGTLGIAEKCAPSQRYPDFRYISGLHELIAHGFVVTATDYPGLGTPGPHPYLVGISEGRAVIDAVRAARAIPASHASSRFIPWGYSQGGHAALFAGTLARAYAPELRLTGIAAGGPPTNLRDTIGFHIDRNRNRLLAAYLMDSWSQVYHLPLSDLLSSRSIRAARLAAGSCLGFGTLDTLAALLHNVHLGKSFFGEHMKHNERWNARFAENSPGIAPAQPYFIAQGMADTVVPPSDTAAYVKKLCASGHHVAFLRLAGIEHVPADADSAGAAIAWIANRFASRTPTNDCP